MVIVWLCLGDADEEKRQCQENLGKQQVVGRTGRSRVRTVGVTFYNLESADSLQPPVIEHLKVASAQIADNATSRIADHHGYYYFVDLGFGDGGGIGCGRLVLG